MAKNKNRNMIVLIVLVALLFFSYSQNKKEAIGTPEGTYCVNSEECLCWSEDGRGIGIGRCVDNACDMNLCFDIKPITDWIMDNPIEYLRSNMLFTALLIGLGIWIAVWPK